jgi:two-component system sensor histidine kinase VicK
MHKDNALGAMGFLVEVAERTSQLVFGFDVNSNRFIYLNPSFEVIWNKTRESVYANPAALLETVHPEDRAYLLDAYEKLLKGTMKKELEFRIVVPNNLVRWLYLTPLIIQQEEGQRTIAGFAEDRTSLRENQFYVQKFAARKNSLLEILSHDLSGPLSNIQGLSSLLTAELQHYNNPKLNKLVEMVATTSERSIGMIREFVKQEFMESVNVDLIRERTNVVELIEQIMSQYQASAQDIGKTFNFITSDDEIYAEVDEYKFNQVINNLISNAIKFTHDGGVITIRIENQQKTVLVSVADNGIGIPAKYHQNLFEKFTKAKRMGLKGEPSLGLGMSLIKTIVEWHKGRVWFKSEEQKGSTFYIELPKE